MALTPFTSTLSLGSYGPQVQALQQFLNANGSPVAGTGQPGSTGMETQNFGQATLAALQKWQAANGIVSSGDPTSTGYGNFGPKTMAAVNAVISQTPQSSVSSSGVVTGGTSNATTDNSSIGGTIGIAPAHTITDPSGLAYFSNGCFPHQTPQ